MMGSKVIGALIAIVFLCIWSKSMTVDAVRRSAPLLIEDDGTRRNNRPAECQFGKTLHELGSTWFADLGPPFGVMYCIKCECVPVTKKRRVVAKAQCKNIKNECPKPNCDDPILVPGKCCKACPGETQNPDTVQDVPSIHLQEEEERNMKYYGALLTTRTSQFLRREEIKTIYPLNNPANVIATGRFTFHKKNLYFSFYTSEHAERPRALQFIDETGHILEEIALAQTTQSPISVYQNTTGKVCGVWRRVPREYRRLLRDERLSVVLLWGGKYQADLAIAGKISKFPALPTEMFSSLLEPAYTGIDQLNGAGGTAIVSAVSGPTSSIHLTLVVNGVAGVDEIIDAGLNVRLESSDKKQIVLNESIVLQKPLYDYNVIELSSPVSIHDLRMLTRGKLFLTVESRRRPKMLRIQGPILSRAACELFETLLSPTDGKSRSSGLAWMYLNRDGSMIYNVQTDNMNMQENPMIQLVDDGLKRRTEVEDLTPSFSFNNAVGVIDRVGPRVLEPLYSDNLIVNIANDKEDNIIRGRLIARPVTDARDTAEPILLKRVDTSASASAQHTGMAWIGVDNECTLHYEITLNGFSERQELELYLEEKPIEAPNAPLTMKILDEFNSQYLEGFVIGMSMYELLKLDTNICYLQIKSKETGELLLKAKLKSIKVPNQCLPYSIDNNVPNGVALSANDHTDNNVPSMEVRKCYHSGRFYDEGEQWRNGVDACSMCSCIYGHVKCEETKCPPLKCKGDDVRSPRNGECCPYCAPPKDKLFMESMLTNSTTRGCILGEQFHLAGSSWYPYLPPNGFDTCTVCTCDPITLDVKCPHVQCPPLPCSDKVAYRPDKKACCKKCPEIRHAHGEKKVDNDFAGDQGSKLGTIKSPEEVLVNGGCKVGATVYENGQEWHPIITSIGEQKCVNCRCKDGKVNCDRKRCTRSVCNNSGGRMTTRKRLNGLTADPTVPIMHSTEECCTVQCKRARRHHNQKLRLHRERLERLQQENQRTSSFHTKS